MDFNQPTKATIIPLWHIVIVVGTIQFAYIKGHPSSSTIQSHHLKLLWEVSGINVSKKYWEVFLNLFCFSNPRNNTQMSSVTFTLNKNVDHFHKLSAAVERKTISESSVNINNPSMAAKVLTSAVGRDDQNAINSAPATRCQRSVFLLVNPPLGVWRDGVKICLQWHALSAFRRGLLHGGRRRCCCCTLRNCHFVLVILCVNYGWDLLRFLGSFKATCRCVIVEDFHGNVESKTRL